VAKEIIVDFKELATLIAKAHGLREGLWGIWVKFGVGAANVGPDSESLAPAAIIPVLEVGIQRFSEPSNLTIDAAEIWSDAAREATGSSRARPKIKPKRVASRRGAARRTR